MEQHQQACQPQQQQHAPPSYNGSARGSSFTTHVPAASSVVTRGSSVVVHVQTAHAPAPTTTHTPQPQPADVPGLDPCQCERFSHSRRLYADAASHGTCAGRSSLCVCVCATLKSAANTFTSPRLLISAAASESQLACAAGAVCKAAPRSACRGHSNVRSTFDGLVKGGGTCEERVGAEWGG